MLHVYYLPDEQCVTVDEGDTILDASLQSGIPHTHICGGIARCSTCRVLIIDGLENCGDRTRGELDISERLRFEPVIRLACQTQVFGDVKLRRLAIDADDIEFMDDEIAGKIVPQMIGQEKQLAILFADIRSFTPFAERLPPYDVIYVLNRYFRRMGQVINRYDGMINNYIGDGLMALFGLENPERATEQAVRAALEMIEAMDKFNPYLETLYHQQLRIGIGIHYGWAVIGKVGAPDSQKLTAIGDAVNLAARIEAANKQVGTTLLISEDAYAQVREQVVVNRYVSVRLPGKSGEYPLYEVVEMSPLSSQEQISLKERKTSSAKVFFTNVKRLFALCWKRLQNILKFP